MRHYYCYWGKAEKEGSQYHLLPYHCLDVAAVAAFWWDNSPAIRRVFREASDLPEKQLRAWVLFFIALHDYGKLDVRMQLKASHVWQIIYPVASTFCSDDLPSVFDCKKYFHGEGGLYWYFKDKASPRVSILDRLEQHDPDRPDPWKPWLEAVTGHHGHLKDANNPDLPLPASCAQQRLAEIDRLARQEWLQALEQLFLAPAGLLLSDTPPHCPKQFLAGFCSVADWLGSHSGDEGFPYCQNELDLPQYFEKRYVNNARQILGLAGVIGHPYHYIGVHKLLSSGKRPHMVQTLVDELPLDAGLAIVEAPTGSGKTEAALAYAWRLISSGMADSIVFALPTQATANAMLDRLQQLVPKLYADHPNLLLAHGSAHFNNIFSNIKHTTLEGLDPDEDGLVQCSKWLAESRKRVFLGQVGVCTVDQVLISVLPVKHRFVRGFGVGRSVLIVDEVHAYDAYMYGLLEEVLRQQKECGGSAILLSATLPEKQRKKLCSAWGTGLESQGKKAPYPLITWAGNGDPVSYKLEKSQLPKLRVVSIEPIRIAEMIPDTSLLQRIVTAAENGAQVAIVCNLVDVAQGIARTLRGMTEVPVDLFHARYCFTHRRDKELAAIENFGLKETRNTGRILVATQVVEQSLDVDFDWLITQLCPVDLLFQRMGRLHRHEWRTNRPAGFETPHCTVLLPEGNDYGLHGYVYANTRILWRTAEKLLSATDNVIEFPDAYRNWIEPIYTEDAWKSEPEEVTVGYDNFKSHIEDIKRYNARSMVNSAMNPFSDNDENVLAITRDGEMNLTVVPFCQTPQGKMLMDGTIFETFDEYQRLEVLSLNSVGVPATWRGYLGNSDEGRFWLELEREGEGYRGSSNGVTFRYHKDMGLEREK